MVNSSLLFLLKLLNHFAYLVHRKISLRAPIHNAGVAAARRIYGFVELLLEYFLLQFPLIVLIPRPYHLRVTVLLLDLLEQCAQAFVVFLLLLRRPPHRILRRRIHGTVREALCAHKRALVQAEV